MRDVFRFNYEKPPSEEIRVPNNTWWLLCVTLISPDDGVLDLSRNMLCIKVICNIMLSCDVRPSPFTLYIFITIECLPWRHRSLVWFRRHFICRSFNDAASFPTIKYISHITCLPAQSINLPSRTGANVLESHRVIVLWSTFNPGTLECTLG